MGRIAVLRPETTKVALKEGDWVEFKNYLTAGERQLLSGAGLEAIRQGDGPTKQRSIELNFQRLGLGRLEIYVVAWSFLNFDSKPLAVSPESIAALTEETFQELDEALDAHIKLMEAAKKAAAPAPVPVGS